MKSLAIAAIAFLAATPSSFAASNKPFYTRAQAKWFNGSWSGVALQSTVPVGSLYREYSVVLHGDSTSRSYTVEYTSLGCGGNLEVVSFNGNKAVFREHFTHNNLGVCEEGEIIVTKLGARFVTYSEFDPTGVALTSYSTLQLQ